MVQTAIPFQPMNGIEMHQNKVFLFQIIFGDEVTCWSTQLQQWCHVPFPEMNFASKQL